MRRTGVVIAALVAVGTSAAVSMAPAHALARPYPIQAVVPSAPEYDVPVSVDAEGRYAVANDGRISFALIDLATGATTPLPSGAQSRVQGRWIIDLLDGNRFTRTDVITGASSTYTVPFSATFRLGGVRGYSDDGRVVGVAGLLQNDLSRWFLYDTATGLLLISEPGVPTIEPNSVMLDVGRDGSTIMTAEYLSVGVNFSRVRRVDVMTGQTTIVERPAEHDAFASNWFPSSDLQWVWFRSASAVVPGFPAGTSRWYRRHVATGVTHALPVDARRVLDVIPNDDGRLVFTMTPTGDEADLQAYLWSGPWLEPEMLTVDATGKPGDRPVRPSSLWWSEDGDRVTVLSFASNLAAGVPTLPGGRLYQIALPDAAAANPTSIVPPSGTLCVPAAGAEPGDVVVVNVTPVLAAAPGFGTIHPGGTSAGSTSNVNFTAGVIDPNVAIVEVSSSGTICFTNSEHGPVHVVIDELVVGDGAAFRAATALGADRVVDTRIGLAGTTLAPGERRCFPVVGASPGETVVVNALAVNASGPGYGTFHSSDTAAGSISSINYAAGSFDPNLALVVVGVDGNICYTNGPTASTDVVADELVVGGATVFRAPTQDGAVRLMDTRIGLGGGVLAASERRCIAAVGADPGEYVALNATPVEATALGFGTLHSSDDGPGLTSNVNFGPGSVDPNVSVTRVGSDGQVCFTNSQHASLHVVLDELVVGGGSFFELPSPLGAVRLVDTRVGR